MGNNDNTEPFSYAIGVAADLATLPRIPVRGYRGGAIFIPATNGNTGIALYAAESETATPVPAMTQAAEPAEVELTIEADTAMMLPLPVLHGQPFIVLVGDTEAVTVSVVLYE